MRFLLLAASLLAACASPATVSNPYVATAVLEVRRIALAPGSGALVEAVGAELAQLGFDIVPPDAAAVLLARADAEDAALRTDWLRALEPSGIDAVLVVDGPAPGTPQTGAILRLLRVPDGGRIAEIRWRNRFGVPERLAAQVDRYRVPRELARALADRLRS